MSLHSLSMSWWFPDAWCSNSSKQLTFKVILGRYRRKEEGEIIWSVHKYWRSRNSTMCCISCNPVDVIKAGRLVCPTKQAPMIDMLWKGANSPVNPIPKLGYGGKPSSLAPRMSQPWRQLDRASGRAAYQDRTLLSGALGTTPLGVVGGQPSDSIGNTVRNHRPFQKYSEVLAHWQIALNCGYPS